MRLGSCVAAQSASLSCRTALRRVLLFASGIFFILEAPAIAGVLLMLAAVC